MNKTNVKSIIKNHLTRNGYDGLFNERLECWCAREDKDFLTCEDIPEDCQPGKKAFCNSCKEDCFLGDSGELTYCIKERKEDEQE